MAQITIRASDDLIRRVKEAARHEGESMNEWVVLVLESVTNPEYAGDRGAQLRERLRRAGLLEEPAAGRGEPPDAARVAAARRNAGKGRPLSEYVLEDRGR